MSPSHNSPCPAMLIFRLSRALGLALPPDQPGVTGTNRDFIFNIPLLKSVGICSFSGFWGLELEFRRPVQLSQSQSSLVKPKNWGGQGFWRLALAWRLPKEFTD